MRRLVPVVWSVLVLASAAAPPATVGPGARPAAPSEGPVTHRLWAGDAPGASGQGDADVPSVTVYPAPRDKANGAAVVVCPGGAYRGLADHEGRPVAEWLNTLGVTGVVLRYRLGPKYHHPAMLHDVGRAVRTVRARAGEWGVDPNRVGVLGFSAGGHLASTAATHFDEGDKDAADPVDRQSSRPDIAVLIYPVITLAGPAAHAGSRRMLLGENPPADLVESLSNEKQVTGRTPPTFLVHSADDAAVPPENSLLFAAALTKNRVPFALHVLDKGGHGYGLGTNDPALRAWTELCAEWLRGRGFLQRQDAPK